MAAALPIDDRRLLVLARQDCVVRGWTSGFMVRDAYMRAQQRGGFSVGPTTAGVAVTWTAGLKRLVRAGELRQIELVGLRHGAGGVGFCLPHQAGRRRA